MFAAIPCAGKLDQLPPFDPASGLVNVVIDTPRHSRCKYRYAEALGLFRLGKLLPLGSSFPFDFGFVPSTAADDGDPLDVLVILSEPVLVGCVASVRLIGVLKAEQTERDGKTVENHRLIGVVETEFNSPEFQSLDDLGAQRLSEIEHFFESYNDMEGKQFRSLGYQGEDEARRLVERASHSRPERDGRPMPAANNKGHTAKKPRSNGYRLKPDEAAGKGMKRIALRQIKRALEELEQARSGDEKRVHDLRKRFKRLRAALRLVRDDIGKRKYRSRNSDFRNAAHAFNDVRDARVLVDSLGRLAEHSDELPGEVLGRFRELLEGRAREAFDRARDADQTFESVEEMLKRGRRKIGDWRVDAGDWRELGAGLERVYRQSFQGFAAATISQSTENLHEWRKRAKYFWHGLQIVETVWPEGMAEFGDDVHELTNLLGDDHDLAMLQRVVDEAGDVMGAQRDSEAVSHAIAKRRVALQSEAIETGRRVFREDSSAIKRRINAARQ